MILIISQKNEKSAFRVKEWLEYFNQECVFIEDDEKVELIEINIENKENSYFILKYKNTIIHSDNITAYWYRRGNLNIDVILKKDALNSYPEIFKKELEKFLYYETKELILYISYILNKKKKLGDMTNHCLNKLIVLDKAKKAGLSIPSTNIFTNKDILKKYNDKYKNKIITKSISENINFTYTNFHYSFLTNKISSKEIANIPDEFCYSLIQKEQEKKYELRIFFFKNSFYSMAIFSQLDKQTKTDFRDYNYSDPNPFVPYNLPKNIENKLKKLNKSLDIDTGSIDMIVTNKNEYVFLEINPVGILDMVTVPCNYYLEQKIANYLASN
jgi:ATP-GRASP peptide maturase of grasp-with-spasm system